MHAQHTSLQLPTCLTRSLRIIHAIVPIHASTNPISAKISKYIDLHIIIRAIPKAINANPENKAVGQVMAKHSFGMFRKKTKWSYCFYNSSYCLSDTFSVYYGKLLLF